MGVFKLIAIRPLEGCERHVLKCLSCGSWYYLCHDTIFEDVTREEGIISFRLSASNTYSQPLSDDFYNLKTENPRISISAIVGMNGDGKSSLIELLLRLIHNHIVKYENERFNSYPISGVYADCLYEIEGQYYLLRGNTVSGRFDSDIYWLKQSQVDTSILRAEKQDSSDIMKWGKIFYYTYVSNFSHYAYNVNDFRSEWNSSVNSKSNDEHCWLFKVFHKNDGYRTPLNINPYRSEGNIDINRENDLTEQRLLSLFINQPPTRDSRESLSYINGKIAESVVLYDAGSSKLQQNTIIQFFTNVRNINSEHSVIELLKDDSISNEDKEKDVLSAIDRLRFIYNQFIKENRSELDIIRGWSNKHPSMFANDSDIAQLFDQLIRLQNEKTKSEIQCVKDLIPEELRVFNVLQLQRIQLIHNVIRYWTCGHIGCISENVKNYFRTECCKVGFISQEYDSMTWIERCAHYVIYKTISIMETYENFGFPLDIYTHRSLQYESQLKKENDEVFQSLLKIQGDISNGVKKSHVTLKLRQALNYLERNVGKENENEEYHMLSDEQYTESVLDSVKIDDVVEKLVVRFTDMRQEGDEMLNLENLPPRIFNSEIVLRVEGTENKFVPMSSLSSGEKQLLASLSSIIYHLRNIDNKVQTSPQYENINIILEEIELYFHADYQRRIIKLLVSMIERSRLQHIKRVNLVFVTHSPFVLSDIVKRNVLFLREGKPHEEMQDNTFGANIHSMLKNGFFLPNLPIGDFAHDKINDLFKILNEGRVDEKNADEVYQEIRLVGEPYIRAELLKLYKPYHDLFRK